MSNRGSDVYALRLQVGRRLSNPLLTLVVFLRELTMMLIDPFGSGAGAPAWVHVEERATKELKWRVAAGRQLGAGEQILGSMQEDLEGMTPNEFEGQWRR